MKLSGKMDRSFANVRLKRRLNLRINQDKICTESKMEFKDYCRMWGRGRVCVTITTYHVNHWLHGLRPNAFLRR